MCFSSRGISSSKVTVLGYGLLTTGSRPLLEALTRQRFSVVVVDESHYLKSRNAARTKILVPLIQSAKRAILLTGTPALGRPEEVNTPQHTHTHTTFVFLITYCEKGLGLSSDPASHKGV